MKDKFKPSVCGVGFIGDGVHKVHINGKISKAYSVWSHMLARCYSDLYQKSKPAYKGCAVCPEWHDFQVFGDWFALNYVDGYHLDKDILKQGNRIYSPDACIFVSHQINSLFIDRKKGRGAYKLGVSWNKGDKKFQSHCREYGKLKRIGCYTSEDEAHDAYKAFKYKLIADVAVTQDDPIKTAMINYVIPEY